MRIFSSKICLLAYFTTKLARISLPIAFQANGKNIILDSLLRSICWGHASNGIYRCPYNTILFLWVVSCGPISCLSWKILRTSWQNGCSYKNGSLGKDVPSVGTLVGLFLALTWQAASALLGLASLPLTSWSGLSQWSDWPPYWLGALVRIPGDCSWRCQVVGPTPLQVALQGPWNNFFPINDWRATIRWLVLGGPWKACLWLQNTGQSPTRRFLKKMPQLVGILGETAFLNQLFSMQAFL